MTFIILVNANKPTSYIIFLNIIYLPSEILDWANPKDFNIDNYSIHKPVDCLSLRSWS